MRLASGGDEAEEEEEEEAEEGWGTDEDEDDDDAADADDNADGDDDDDGKQEEDDDDDEQGAMLGPGKGRHWLYYREEEKEVTRLMQRLNRCARPCACPPRVPISHSTHRISISPLFPALVTPPICSPSPLRHTGLPLSSLPSALILICDLSNRSVACAGSTACTSPSCR